MRAGPAAVGCHSLTMISAPCSSTRLGLVRPVPSHTTPGTILVPELESPGSGARSSFSAFQRKKPTAIGVKAPSPGFIEPALATPIDKVPSGARWVHEIKFDGYRVQVHLKDGTVKEFTRRANDWTRPFRKIPSDSIDTTPPPPIPAHPLVVPPPNPPPPVPPLPL